MLCDPKVYLIWHYLFFVGLIADAAHAYGPAFFTAGGIMIFGSSLAFLRKFITNKGFKEEEREIQLISLEYVVYERETVL